ncbi:MAG: hypothetical protein COZ37_00370 [bacterium (Candidatus Ratteibacteria) CG_4_10_14_3_um_filter_41_18]|uniref:DUF3786 domain-containing protein n=3 Tax=Candidatus Ratteibacteria TaxID=2979319 RepID=A0A2M7YH19_9BACT|nr:MAG: hypothetical protein AUJ76_04440 [Candidatus Omnitrophica bacterium CG1_02_41_171]PIW32522.1 MAG: hypothetical protein COW28_05840 [bacterium (Candidatus Ratteibacteria) CG15_BIG_FIL_POST_REV_8_21_14_020_41_12]PIW74397.1 MAG: hypothetical protein CO004_00910 [bacterium (Candidatus Ratteibacteria) CG_4_8_14_3_um_filter_41_36]PIX77878.1 MAG: hypothetical protein COZ37_00370 [bacterium (Candidatus Ratteibacteria) CG_4_10_14_3_um_filter_41_18]PJA62262.1 MAG: hypothetical protein CO162_02005
MDSALELAIKEFKGIDLKNISQRSGATLNKEGIKIDYLNQGYSIRLPEVEISYINFSEAIRPPHYNREGEAIRPPHYVDDDKGEAIRPPHYVDDDRKVSSREKIIILHYLNRSKGTLLSDKLIDFREIPGGNLYYSVFESRVHKPFLKFLGEKPSLLLEAGLSLKGTKTNFGDSSVRILAFPKVPIDFIIYQGNEEFLPTCKVLFDSSVYDYLTTEDIVFVCEDAVGKLTK